ncbi:MAG TPA: phosphatase PAP2 family protein [Hyphomicrobiales bacterium]|nr:phosphatase PAP2 family protein [Hyphomicrobiales bacterium]
MATLPYLTADQRPDTTAILNLAPQKGSVEYETDRTIFKTTRALKDTPYWDLATRDARLDLPSLMANFDCALGTKIDLASMPALKTLMSRSLRDALVAMNAPKRANKRARPFLIDEGPVCEPKEHLTSYDFPSGHSAWGWTIGLIFAEMAPDRATDILERARAYAESRVICGAHNESAIVAGETIAGTVVAVLHSSPAFTSDLAKARAELVAQRKAVSADAGLCKAEHDLIASEHDLLAKPPY